MRALSACFLLLALSRAAASPESELLGFLEGSGGGLTARAEAIQGLSVCGTARSVPTLRELLEDDGLWHAALHALESIDAPEAGEALRDALGSTTGLVRIGVIDALGRMHDDAAVPLIRPLLDSGEKQTASAAAYALGRIGGQEATDALLEARGRVSSAVLGEVEEALLFAAEHWVEQADLPTARLVYQELVAHAVTDEVRTGAWRGLVLSDPRKRAELVSTALAGDDDLLRQVALTVVREVDDQAMVRACVARWGSLDPGAQVAVLEAHLGFGKEALPTIRLAGESAQPEVRASAWRGYAQINDSSGIPALVRAAASGAPDERKAAEETLAWLHGSGVSEALYALLERVDPEEKAALLRVLGARADLGATELLLRYAGGENGDLRRAALDSLRMIAAPESLVPLLDLAAVSSSDSDRRPVLTTLAAVCRATPDREAASRVVIKSLGALPEDARLPLLPLLAALATDEARATALSAARGPQIDMAAAAVRVLSQWPDASPAVPLLELAGSTADPRMRRLSFRGALAVSAKEPDPVRRLTIVRQAAVLAGRVGETSQVLARLGGIPLPGALELARKSLSDPEVTEEAVLATLDIAEQLAASEPTLAAEAAVEALAHTTDPDLMRRVMALAPAPASAQAKAGYPPRDSYERLRLSDDFLAEGAYTGDFNRDGSLDVVAGPFWFEGPTFEVRHEYRPSQVFNPLKYSDNFLTYTDDLDGDGWTDVLCVPFPGKEGYWYRNPTGESGLWERLLAYPFVGNESPMWCDVTGDGKPELLFCNDGYLGYAGPDPGQPEQPWVFHAISNRDARFQRFTHGVGAGDINADGRPDVLEATGWWEQPERIEPGQPWIFHPFPFANWAAQMHVYDVDGDGLQDVITAWHCHHYGMVWWKQRSGADGEPGWEENVIFAPEPDVSAPDFRVSQLHAIDLVDMNGDGLLDLVTGKRFWAHGPEGDKEPSAPAVVFWLELRRNGDGQVHFIPHLVDDDSGVGTQVATADLNGDDRPDIVVANKKGIFLHLSRRE